MRSIGRPSFLLEHPRTTFQGLIELKGLLLRYLTVAFPGTTYSSET